MSKETNKTIVYSALEVANICGVVNQTAINWIRNGYLEAFSTPGGQYRVYLDDLISFMKERNMRIPKDLLAYVDSPSDLPQSVLIVDDDQGLNNVLAKYISKNFPNFEVFQAFDGFEAGAILADKKPRLVLLDLSLPGVDGFSLCKKIKTSEEFGIPSVFAITALEDDDVDAKINIGRAHV